MKIIDTALDNSGCEYTVAVLGTENLTELSFAEQRCFPEDPWTVKMLEDTLKSNAAAIELYKKLGFINVGKRKNYYTNPREDAIVMILGEEI